ncbi:uncharacterized protein LOC132891580 [Neoarius graeffei]|uniref:uncharacterized protein LOC132891176 n=1 Tax=Neoarius graeffei TaxID=443677 RepID=UPI00298D330A|nr:uncharacterized protein LOC132891176 [Neoarius graeffei]XP_060785274.1 uncharacterized protein LOC132891580 [Neoarius graeffei]
MEGRGVQQRALLRHVLQRLLTRLEHVLQQPHLDMDFMQFVCCQERVFLSAIAGQVTIPAEVIAGIDELDRTINTEIDQEKVTALSMEQGARGRPKTLISDEQISSLLELSFPVPTIADLLGVSIRTVRRRMEEFNLSVRASYSNLSNEQLDGIVSEIKTRMPRAGYRMMKGALEAEGHKVQWDRIRASLHRVDTLGVYSCMINLGCVVRRSYFVPSPRFLMHIDTNHKLIRLVFFLFNHA